MIVAHLHTANTNRLGAQTVLAVCQLCQNNASGGTVEGRDPESLRLGLGKAISNLLS